MPDVSAHPVTAALRAAGWREGRDCVASLLEWKSSLAAEGFEMFPAAEAVLREFGGLKVVNRGPGEELARSSFEVDPSLASGERDRFAAFEAPLGKRLFPLGEVDEGHAFLACADDGKIYMLGDRLWFLGADVREAFGKLIIGLKAEPVAIASSWS